jgi:hypothetical protein
MTEDSLLYARLAPQDPRRGRVLRCYSVDGLRFVAGAWMKVDPGLAERLRLVRQLVGNDDSPLAFEFRASDDETDTLAPGALEVTPEPATPATAQVLESRTARAEPRRSGPGELRKTEPKKDAAEPPRKDE